MSSLRLSVFSGVFALASAGLVSCYSASVGPDAPSAIAFSVDALALGGDRVASLQISNTGSRAVGPVELVAGAVQDASGNTIAGAVLRAAPNTVPTLNPGASALVTVAVDVGGSVQVGSYQAELVARVPADVETSVVVDFDVEAPPTTEIDELVVTTVAGSIRQGDVFPLNVEGRVAGGGALEDLAVRWTVAPAASGFVDGEGNFVGYQTGPLSVTAEYGGLSASLSLTVVNRGLSGSLTKVGEAAVDDRFTSDLWVFGQHAYTGTWGRRTVGASANFGNQLHVWDITDPSRPTLTRELTVDARTVNDVKIRADGQLGVLTHEGSNDGRNGVTLLDLSDPGHPVEITRFTDGLTSGIHNTWVDGDFVYLVLDGVGNGLRVMDVSNPAAPSIVGSFYAGSSFLHDVYVRDGLAFLSHWGAGLVVLDVGNGMRGGTPSNPVEVSRIELGGQTHNAWYWPERGYVFVGEEDFNTPGIMRVVDLRNPEAPEVAATFRVPGTTPHNFWLDEASQVLYLAWYENGVRALDVSGELMGELDRQGREIVGAQYDGFGGCASGNGTCSWAPQLHDGRLFVSDMNTGMVVLTPGS